MPTVHLEPQQFKQKQKNTSKRRSKKANLPESDEDDDDDYDKDIFTKVSMKESGDYFTGWVVQVLLKNT